MKILAILIICALAVQAQHADQYAVNVNDNGDLSFSPVLSFVISNFKTACNNLS